ncbi:hypothetical protein FBU59_001533 [Linderina macrospora]|uniref:Uncharacterized protein n=1 Tax=Linderina macrospora TaxID=4868 RepID=A0ACC1JDK2_9FUNG|nr:hypothetical protein FBU59_001533 [Linderina macrospora]
MDVDRMVETYLPHLYAQSQMGQQVPTPTASPDSALAESDVVQVVPTVVHSLPAIGVEHDGGPAASKLRATASTMNMRAMFHRPPGEIAEPQLPARLGNRATPRDSIMVSRRALGRSAGWQVSRRRSEVEELISQANAVLDGSKRISGASQIRPPRSSLPVGSRWSQGSLASSRFSLPANRSSMAESLISSTPGSRTSSIRSLDPFSSDSNGLLSPADSYLTGMRSVSPASRIPSPTSGLRAPTPLLAALNRQQYRLESTRVESQVPSPLSARSVRSVRSVSHDGHLSSSSASLPHLGSSISSGLRAPSSLTTRLRESASLGQASAVSRTLISGIRPPQYSSESAVSHVRAAATSSVNSMSGLRQPSDLRKLRPVKSTSTSLRSMYTEESQRRATAEAATAAGRKPDVRTIFKPDMEFLTLRPVHTPDLVIRKFDPRMVERAMTPMLKTSVRLSAMSRGKMPNFDSDSELESESEATVSEMNSDTPVNDSTAKFSSTLPTIPGSPAVDSYRHQSDETLGVSASIEELLDAYRDDYIDSNVPSMAYLPDCDDVEVKMESRISDLGSPVLGPEKHAHRRFPTPKFLGLRRKQSQPSLIKPPSTSSVGRLSSSLIPRFSTSKQRQQQQQPSPQQQPSGIPAMRKTKSLWSLKSTWNR